MLKSFRYCVILAVTLLAVGFSVQADSSVSPLGIGFLITRNTESLLPLLTSERDFLEMVPGPAKVKYIEALRPPAKAMCISMSVTDLAEAAEMLQNAGISLENIYFAYNPERRGPRQTPVTPDEELDDLLTAIAQARQALSPYNGVLVVGPGLSYMEKHADLYPKAAALSDIWMIQTQRLEADANGQPVSIEEYRREVKKIVDLLRQGNPQIRVFVQIVPGLLTHEMTAPITATQVAAYLRNVDDLVDAAAIYGGDIDVITEVVTLLRNDEALPAKGDLR